MSDSNKQDGDSVTKSCKDCSFFVGARDADAQSGAYGAPVNFASCAKKGLYLSPSELIVKDAAERNDHLKEVASTCDSFDNSGRVRTIRRRTAGLSVGLQMLGPEALAEVSEPLPMGGGSRANADCNKCAFASKKGAGWMGVSGTLCLARAEMLPMTPLSSTQTASNCESYSPSPMGLAVSDLEKLLGNMMITPGLSKFMEVDSVFGYTIREVIAANKPFEFVEPSTYPTDAEVTEQDKADGIRAWRKIFDTQQKRAVLIPVFDSAYFSEDERKKIPQSGDKEHPEMYQDHANNAYKVATLWFKMDETPCLQGVAGTGKTEFYRYMAWLMQLPFERVSITRSSELDDLAGKMLFENNETVFQKGRIPKAWSKPSILCLDEPNVGPLDVWQFIRPLTDNSKQLVLDMNNGETVTRHKYCRMGMAINPSWDSRNIGAEPLADADSNRLAHVFVDFPTEPIERSILKNRCKSDGYQLPDDVLDKVMAIALSLRKLSEDEDLPITWGIRQQIKVARATEYFDLEDCYKMAAADNLEPEVAEVILNTVRMKSTPTNAWGSVGTGRQSTF